MLVPTSAEERIASKIDIRLCDLCGVLRMTDGDTPQKEGVALIAYQITEVRRDIGKLAAEHREAYAALEARMSEQHSSLAERLRQIELKDARDSGAVAGIRSFVAILFSAAAALGGVVGWMISYFTNKK